MQIHIEQQNWPIAGGFRISRGSKTQAEVLVVTLIDRQQYQGHGECVPYARYGESQSSVRAQIETVRPALCHEWEPAHLQELLSPGAARNALDCAWWDLKSQQSAKPVWQLTHQPAPGSVTTAFTLSLDQPVNMAQAAQQAKNCPVLKVKLSGDITDIDRVHAIAKARPDAGLILDGNEGFSLDDLTGLCHQIQGLNVLAIEQPLPASDDEALADFVAPFALCADESLHTRADLAQIARRYDMINIKLDKTGGLSEALALMAQARQQNLKIMVGCMVATSLSMAPALVLAVSADLVDLDGPLLLAKDRTDGLIYQGSEIPVQKNSLWGYPRRR